MLVLRMSQLASCGQHGLVRSQVVALIVKSSSGFGPHLCQGCTSLVKGFSVYSDVPQSEHDDLRKLLPAVGMSASAQCRSIVSDIASCSGL